MPNRYNQLSALEKISPKSSSMQISGKSASVEKKGKGRMGYVVGTALIGGGALGSLICYLKLLDIEEKLDKIIEYVYYRPAWQQTPRETIEWYLRHYPPNPLYPLLLERLNILGLIYICGVLTLFGIGIIACTYLQKKYGKPKIIFVKE